jgi:hypothetical protein
MGFLEWLQRPPKPIAPACASNLLYAVKHHLICHGLDTTNQISAAVLSKQMSAIWKPTIARNPYLWIF